MAGTPLAQKWKNARVRHVHRHRPVINVNEIEQFKPSASASRTDSPR